MPKVHDNWKKISIGEFDTHATEYLTELVAELLWEKGVDASAYAFSIDIDYLEVEDE